MESNHGIRLPESEIIESGYLESMLLHNTSSYKYFWFKAIYDEVQQGNSVIPYKRLVARMIAYAWYPVIYYKLHFGAADKLAQAVTYIHQELHVKQDEKQDKIITFICDSTDKKLNKFIKDFLKYVPQRLLSPFYQRELEYEKKQDISFHDGKVNAIIEKYNRNDQDNAFYQLDTQQAVLTVSPSWVQYLRLNAAVIEGWWNYKVIAYMQKRNPNVPAIPFKIFPPTEKDRDLTVQMRYWKQIQQRLDIRDMYTDLEFSERNLEKYGTMSLDHFIPWRFVLHNEIWNLCPTFKNVNSKKGDRLPDRERYLEKFCENQYAAFLVGKEIQKNKEITEQYLHIQNDIFQIEKSDRGHDAFVTAMRQTIEPLYQIANHQGYGIWWYEDGKVETKH